jgi:anti-sigma factor RsiW
MTTGRPITEDELHAYVDQALDPARRAEVEDYLAHHPEVARRVAGDVQQRDQLRAALAPIAEEPVPPELGLAQLLEARQLRRPARWQLAIAAVALVGLGGFGGWALRGPASGPSAPAASSGIAALAEEAADSYRVYAPDRVHPVELRAAQQRELVTWVSDRLQRPVAVPDLSAAGYRFMGGRVVATAHGPAGLLMYDDDRGTRMVVLIRPMAIERDTQMAAHESGAVRGFSWAQQGVGYSVVATASPETLHPLADEVRRQVAISG